jgi:hypothetical protein
MSHSDKDLEILAVEKEPGDRVSVMEKGDASIKQSFESIFDSYKNALEG